MANLNKIDVPIAVTHKTKLDLSCDHVTSMNFMTTQPVYYRHMIKGEHISINASSTVRPAPIEVPAYGQLNQNLRYFFVPYRLVFPNWDSFYNDVIASNYSESSLVSSPPVVTNRTLVSVLIGLSSVATDSSALYDFSINNTHYVLSPVGRFLLKILRSLGYEPIWDEKSELEYNALALLAYAKCYVDWYANSQYLNTSDVLNFEQAFKFNTPSQHFVVSGNLVHQFVLLVRNVVYDTDDYFVNAWDNPVSPNSGQFTSFSFTDPTSTGGAYVQTNTNGTPEMIINTDYPQSIGTTYIHEALKRLTDFQKRHALAGARSIDRVLAQYGVITDSLKQQRSIYVGNQQTTIDIGSVYATASGTNTDGSSSSTGDYSGAGFGKKDGYILDFTADEEGIILCIASIIPSGSIVQGYDRNNLHLDKTDFFVPEFDSLGVQAIQRGEVYVSNNESYHTADSDGSTNYTKPFGFTGRYGEYKRPKSFLTGDLSLSTAMQGGSAWHLFRLFDDSSFGEVVYQTHSLTFTRGIDATQYHRIFQYINGDLDPFYCFMHFNVASFAPCKPLFETYEFEENGKQVPTENGNKLN